MFIDIKDLYTKIRPNELQQSVAGDDTIVNHAISVAVSEVRFYLQRYDTEVIFSATGGDRNPLLVTFATDIAIYEILAIAKSGNDLTDRRERRNRAIDYLKQLKDEAMPVNLPLKETEPDSPNNEFVAFGGITKRSNNL